MTDPVSTTPSPTQNLAQITNSIRTTMEGANRAREQALKLSREIIQFSSKSIRAIHRGELEESARLILEAKNRIVSMREATREHPEVYYAGYIHDSQKEYVEAETMLAIISGSTIASNTDLLIESAAYLNGIAEAASESRRYVLDRMRLGDMSGAESVLKVMDDIYYELIAVDFPDAITGGLRRTTDALRAVLERTRADVTHTMSNHRLEMAINAALFASKPATLQDAETAIKTTKC